MKRVIKLASLGILIPTFCAAEPRPNVIQILTDDQGWGDLASYGHAQIKTPHITKLAADGIRFTACYSGGATCSPSRATLLTGRTPYRNGVYRWLPLGSSIHLQKHEVTLPQLLRKGGYQTAHLGKWHLSYYSEKRTAEGYSDFVFGREGEPTMNDYGYDYTFITGNVARPSHRNPLNFFLNGKPVGEIKGYSAQIVAKQFDHWLSQERQPAKPFFMTIWLHEPHGPIKSDPRWIARYEGLKDADKNLKQYYANVTQIDEAVGSIIDSLKKAGIHENTMVWYTSDNGPEGRDATKVGTTYRGSTGGLRGRKRHTHEGGIRVPGIITWPAVLKDAGRVVDTPVTGADFFPTVLEAAQQPLPDTITIDGQSLLPIVKEGPFERVKPLYWRNNHNEYRVALRDGDWKILATKGFEKFELYHIKDDPGETREMSKQRPEIFERMKEALLNYDKEVMEEARWWQQKAKTK